MSTSLLVMIDKIPSMEKSMSEGFDRPFKPVPPQKGDFYPPILRNSTGFLFGILVVFYFMKYDIPWTYYILGSVLTNSLIIFIFDKVK